MVFHLQVHLEDLLPLHHSVSKLQLEHTPVHPSLDFLTHTLFPWLQSGLLFSLMMRLYVHQDPDLSPHLSFEVELYHKASIPGKKLKILNTLHTGAQLQG